VARVRGRLFLAEGRLARLSGDRCSIWHSVADASRGLLARSNFACAWRDWTFVQVTARIFS
jgi:hypothetical protein